MKASGKSAKRSTNGVMYYHADAAPVGGHLTHPKELVVSAKGSVSLGQAGGHAKSSFKKFNPHPSIRTGTAYSEVTGGVNADGNWTTVVTSTVEDLNLFNKVTADRIVAKLSIEHPRHGDHPYASFEDCVFENLRIAGEPVILTLDLGLLSTKPHDFPAVPWPEVAGFVKRAKAQSARITGDAAAPQALKNRFAWMGQKAKRTQKGYIVCSLVAGVQGTVPGSTFGHVVCVPGFGNVFLGELIVDTRSFHLNMLRAEMGDNGTSGKPSSTKPTKGKTGKVKPTPGNLDIEATGDPAPPPAGNFSFASTRGNGFPSL